MSKASERMRREWKASDARRDAGLTTPEGIKRFDDILYGTDPKWHVLDVYRPKDKEGVLPVIVSVHGGGWVYGDKNLYQFYGMTLAQRGFAVVNFSYRLAPEHKYPAPLEDINSVIEWMYDKGQAYGLDREHVFMVGDSAGAHLAALYAGICTNRAYGAHYAFRVPQGFKPKAMGLNCGVYVPVGTENAEGFQDRELVEDFLPGGGTQEEIWLTDATRHVTPDFPPVFLMTAVGDFCRPQAAFMKKALEKNKVPCFFKIYGSEEAPLYHVFHVTIQERAGQQCNDEQCRFFRGFLT